MRALTDRPQDTRGRFRRRVLLGRLMSPADLSCESDSIERPRLCALSRAAKANDLTLFGVTLRHSYAIQDVRVAEMPPWQAEGMRAVVQRVLRASVDVITANGVERSGEIGSGLLALVGVTHDDDDSSADRLADRIANLRICDDEDGVMNRSVLDLGRSVLVVSQFTLYGDTSRGRRPGWSDAARPEVAEPLIERLVERLRAVDIPVATGRFRTEMRVELVNDGPVTVIVDV